MADFTKVKAKWEYLALEYGAVSVELLGVFACVCSVIHPFLLMIAVNTCALLAGAPFKLFQYNHVFRSILLPHLRHPLLSPLHVFH